MVIPGLVQCRHREERELPRALQGNTPSSARKRGLASSCAPISCCGRAALAAQGQGQRRAQIRRRRVRAARGPGRRAERIMRGRNGSRSVWQRRARKCRSAKADYYPKQLSRNGLTARRAPCRQLGRFALPAAAPLAAAPANDVEPGRRHRKTSILPLRLRWPGAGERGGRRGAGRPDPPPAAPPAAPLAATPAAGNSAEAVPLPECLDLHREAARRGVLERRGKPIAIDAAAVGQIGAQCVQVLLSARRTWEATACRYRSSIAPTRMIEDLKLIGIDRTLVTGELPQ